MYYNYLKLSFSDFDNSSKNFGGYLTVSISDDKDSNVSLYQTLRDNNISIDNCIFIGDQLFTDVWGAKRTGILSCLVKPIHPKEEIQIVLKRYLERIVLRSYEKQKAKEK